MEIRDKYQEAEGEMFRIARERRELATRLEAGEDIGGEAMELLRQLLEAAGPLFQAAKEEGEQRAE